MYMYAQLGKGFVSLKHTYIPSCIYMYAHTCIICLHRPYIHTCIGKDQRVVLATADDKHKRSKLVLGAMNKRVILQYVWCVALLSLLASYEVFMTAWCGCKHTTGDSLSIIHTTKVILVNKTYVHTDRQTYTIVTAELYTHNTRSVMAVQNKHQALWI